MQVAYEQPWTHFKRFFKPGGYQKGKGNKSIAPQQEEDNCECVAGLQEEVQLDSCGKANQHQDVHNIQSRKIEVLNAPVCGFAQPMHLHHDAQPACIE